MNVSEQPTTIEEIRHQAYFQFKLDMVKDELKASNDIIARIDGITQALKNWTILIWAGGVSLTIAQPALQSYILVLHCRLSFFGSSMLRGDERNDRSSSASRKSQSF